MLCPRSHSTRGQVWTQIAAADLPLRAAGAPAPEIPARDPHPPGADYKDGGPGLWPGGMGQPPPRKEAPPRTVQGARGPRLQLPNRARSGGWVQGWGTPAPPPAGSSGQGAARAATDPGSTSSLAPRCPDGGKRDARAGRRRAGHAAARRRAPPRGGQGEAALPLPSPVLAPSPSSPSSYFSSSRERRPGARSERSQLPLQSPFFPSARLARASLALKAVNVWSHSSPFSLAMLPVSRSK